MTRTMASHGKTVEAVTVAELKAMLSALPNDYVLTHSEWDLEWDTTYHYVVTGISTSGQLRVAMVDSDGSGSRGEYGECACCGEYNFLGGFADCHTCRERIEDENA